MRYLWLAAAVIFTNYATASDASPEPDDQEQSRWDTLYKGIDVLGTERLPKRAIDDFFELVNASCEEQLAETVPRIYSARTQTETLAYLLIAASDDQAAEVIPSSCAYAKFLKGYALLDLGRIQEATEWVDMALVLSPLNSQFLSERGHIYQLNREWDAALNMYIQAQQSAEEYSPDNAKKIDLAKALWGAGYSFIELGKLDMAEAKFREVLKYESHHERALGEIEYIESIRNSTATEGD